MSLLPPAEDGSLFVVSLLHLYNITAPFTVCLVDVENVAVGS